MNVEMMPKFTVHVEGDGQKIFHAFDKGKMEHFREQFLDTQSRVFDDDPDSDVMGSIIVEDMREFRELLLALPERVMVEMYVEAGAEKANGFKALLSKKDGSGRCDRLAWWYCDTDALVAGVKDKIGKAKDLLSEVL